MTAGSAPTVLHRFGVLPGESVMISINADSVHALAFALAGLPSLRPR